MFSRNYGRCDCMNKFYNHMNVNPSVINEKETNYSCGCNNEAIYDNSCKMYSLDDGFMSDCQCGFDEPYSQFSQNVVLGQSYVPRQRLNKVYKECIGLRKGSLFPELVSPYEPCQSMEEIDYLRRTNIIGEGCNKCQ